MSYFITIYSFWDIHEWDKIGNTNEGLEESRQIVLSLIDDELEKGVPPGRIIIGGFSQGAVVSLHTSIQYKGVCDDVLQD